MLDAGINRDAVIAYSTKKEAMMHKVNNYKIQKESFEDMHKAQRFNPNLEITFHDKHGIHTHKISAGYRDDIYVYREHGITFILVHNQYLGYVGLEMFCGKERVGDIFLEYHQIIETLGRCDFAPYTMISRLKEYISN